MIRVVHITENPIAGAPINLALALNKYQGDKVECRHIANSDRNDKRIFKSDIIIKNSTEEHLRHLLLQADVLHFHNFYQNQELFRTYPHLWGIAKKKPRVWQIHSPRGTTWFDMEEGLKDPEVKPIVIGQYHPRQWPEVKTVVPNVIDIWDPALMPIKRRWDAPLRVAFSPSRIRLPGWDNKGYDETYTVLKKLVDEGLITAEVIYEKPHTECLKRRAIAHVGIDEVVTGSYHLCSLESLSQGLCTIAGLDDTQIATIKGLTGALSHPWFIARTGTLEERLRMLAKSLSVVQRYAVDGRAWMERFWCPTKTTKVYTDIYKGL